MSGGNAAPIIIKKIKKFEAGGHGGAWKVAYADFVTAMMAFFLLLWLLNVTTSEQKMGISDYFAPASPSKQNSGAGGVLGGKTITAPGPQINASSPPQLNVPTPSLPAAANADEQVDDSRYGARGKPDGDAEKLGNSEFDKQGAEGQGDTLGGTGGSDMPKGITEADIRKALERIEEGTGQPYDADSNGDGQIDENEIADLKEEINKAETQEFKETQEQIFQALQKVPELRELAQNVLVDRTPQGTRIQLVDQEGYSMFPGGSAQMSPRTVQLMNVVAKAVANVPNRLSISGHTDSTPFTNGGSYSNWELSTDRANAARRALEALGVKSDRFETVVGKADRDPLFADDPKSPRNRRMSIVLLSDQLLNTGEGAPGEGQGVPPAGDGPAPVPSSPGL